MVIQDVDPNNTVDHFHRTDDPTTQQLTLDALGAPHPLTYDQVVSTVDDTPADR